MADLLDRLRGGDLRSIGRADEVAQEVEQDPSLFGAVFSGLYDTDPVLRMRSADVVEKVTRDKPELLVGRSSEIISLLSSAEQQEVCWHMAQIAPRLACTAAEEGQIVRALKRYLSHKSKIVRVSAMESLAAFAGREGLPLDEAIEIIRDQMATGSPAVRSRGRRLLQRLQRETPQ